jgi:hypothetical protein
MRPPAMVDRQKLCPIRNEWGDDFVIDAPWRSIRDYVPVLFFIPDLKSGQISKFEL